MTIRITIACPENLIEDANQFALCVGNTPADAFTFGAALWSDETGEQYALASLLAEPTFATVASSTLVPPSHAASVDLGAARRAQSLLEVWSPASTGPFPTVAPNKLIAVLGLEAGLAVPLLNLSPIPIEE